ncbi:MAG TPA: PDZ domain-containing protein, partial [Vicinamibacteria bacterium]|nr:PDZ domain-containing protein [Vicinamibacteria bacterium]
MLACVPLLPGAAAAAAADDPAGVVVVRVSPGLAAAKAGVQSGDRLLRWQQGDLGGALASPFDLAEVEMERAPRGPVTLAGMRGRDPLTVSLFPDEWGIEARPALAPPTEEASPEVRAWARQEFAATEAARRRKEAAVAALQEALELARSSARPTVEAQVLTFL